MTSFQQGFVRVFAARELRVFWLPLLAITLGCAVLGASGREILSFDRESIGSGEFWRLITGHFCHLGLPHLLMNMLGALLVGWLVSGRLRSTHWWGALAVCIAGTSAGLWFCTPGLQNYVGLSGVLHGLIYVGLLAGLQTDSKLESLLLLGLVSAKLVVEQTLGPLPGSEASAGGHVIVDAHLFGALSGVVYWVSLQLLQRRLGK